LEWAKKALHESNAGDKAFHAEAVKRLQSESARLQHRLDEMYLDKLDGKCSLSDYERRAAEWGTEQARLLRAIEEHQAANKDYLGAGIDLLELVSKAHQLFKTQKAREKRGLLRFALSNCTWKGGELQPTFRQPFDLLAHTCAGMKKPAGSVRVEKGQNKEWLLR
jgi:site-specific DNA recombinase